MRNILEKHSKTLILIGPFLVLYLAIVLFFSKDILFGDEVRHMVYATNLTQGFYTDSADPEFVNGPGYPLVLAAFSLVKSSYLVMKLVNAVFLVFGVLLFFKTLSLFFSPKQSMLFSYVFGLYPPFLKWLAFLYSESFAIFLACGFLYYFMKIHIKEDKRYLNMILAGAFLGVLTLTKVIFGYVILAALLLYGIGYLFKRSKKSLASILVLVWAFVICLPYLMYTYSFTGEILYWGSGGGEILYWRSSPFPNEYGDWISKEAVYGTSSDDYYDTTTISENHKSFYQSVESYSHIERDRKFSQKAAQNIKQYPFKYLQNTATSAMRLFFNYPYSYTQQKPSSYFYILPNGLLVLFLLFSLYQVLRKPGAIPFEIRFIGIVALTFIGGIIMANGMVRHLLPIIPILLLCIAFVMYRVVRIKIEPA